MPKCKASPLLLSLIMSCAFGSTTWGEDAFKDQVLPFVQAYCARCHNAKTSEGQLNLTRYDSAAAIARDFRQWEHVQTFLKEEKMPPDEAKQPTAMERSKFLTAVENVLLQEARKFADDPGAAMPRRLTNAEYNYTIRDLTGVDIRPASTFPIDPASGEGFNNTGEALTMSPSLFKKYYAAAQHVADHIVPTTSGFEFAPYPVVAFADQQKYYEQAIIRFYEEHKVGYEAYFTAAWSYRHRPATKREATIEMWAAENKLSPKFLRLLWDTLQDDANSNIFYIQWLRQRWNALPDPNDAGSIPGETLRQIRALSGDIQRVSRALCIPETEAIVSNAGNGPVQHIARRKKTAAGRDKFNTSLMDTTQRLQWEIRNVADKMPTKLVIRVSAAGAEKEEGYVVLSRLNFSSSSPNSYNPKDEKKNISMRALLAQHAPDVLKKLTFGMHPLGHAVDADSLVLKAPSQIEIEIPKESLMDSRRTRFFAEASLDREHSKLGMARIALFDQLPKKEDFAEGVLLVNREHPSARQFTASCESFCKLFPNRFYYVDDTRGLSAGFHLIEGFFRDDQPLCQHVLSDAEKRQLDRLWDELYFATKISEKELRGFVFFERSERNFMKHPDFDSIKEEDPDLIKPENLLRFEKIYLKRSGVDASVPELASHPIHTFFEELRQGLERRSAQLKQAEPAYVRQLQEFAKSAYRRPLTSKETKDLLDFYHSVAKQQEFGIEQALRASITRVLVSPYFCYQLGLPPSGKTIQPITDVAMASRLSYFLWSSMPDKELLDFAIKGQLNNESTLRAQMRRMLKDPKVGAFALEFFGQWLQYRDFLEKETVNRQVFPEFNDALKQAMFEEPSRFAVWLIQNDLPATELLHSDVTFVNQRLAQHYGIPFRGTEGDWEKATGMLQHGRGGFLGMAVFLTKNSQPQRTSPVKRGFWVVHKLLGQHIPAPPAQVAPLPVKETDTKGKSIRELLKAHTENVTCARCHQQFDPVGLAMEGFDSIGKSRTKDLAGRAIDNVVLLPTGKSARGVPEFSEYLLASRKHEFTRTLCRKFLGYALGRSIELSDLAPLEKMQADLEKNDDRFMTLFESVVMSPQFRNQRGRDYAPGVKP